MDIKSNLQLLSEAAATDLKVSSESNLKVYTVKEAYASIPEAPEVTVTEASDVIVTKTKSGEYYTEMVSLAPFMLDAKLTSVSKALDLVAEANGLADREVGLIVESQKSVDETIDKAAEKAKKTGNNKVLENALNKVNKNNAIIARLLSEGYKVAKKKADSEVCPDCGKVSSKCDCLKTKEEQAAYQEFAALVEQCTETRDITPLLEFFTFKGHKYKNEAELKAYIKEMIKRGEDDDKLVALATILISMMGSTTLAVIGGPLVAAAAFSIGSIINLIVLILSAIKRKKYRDKLRNHLDKIADDIEKKAEDLQDKLEEENDKEAIKKLKDNIRDYKKGLRHIEEILDKWKREDIVNGAVF